MIETLTSKNIRKIVPLILVILAALFFLNSCKNKMKEEVFNPNRAKINFKWKAVPLTLAPSILGLDCH